MEECTLRAAIQQANAATGADVIDINVTGAIGLQSALPDLNTDMDINGPGAGQLTVQRSTSSGTPEFRIFRIGSSNSSSFNNSVSISGLTVSGGKEAHGGSILNSQYTTLALESVAVSNNTAYHDGGGIHNSGTLTLTRSAISGNTAGISGGGIHTYPGTLTLTDSTVSNNTAYNGGGISAGGTVTVTNSTISNNMGTSVGGGVTNDGALTLANATIKGNNSPQEANVRNFGADAKATFQNTIVADPQGGGANCGNTDGTITSAGYNLEYPGTSCGFAGTGDIQNQDPKLGPLADNGGPTRTHPLQPGSPAIDAVASASCPPPSTDQRGVSRPQGARCDMGAFELELPPETTITSGPSGTVNSASATFEFISSEANFTFECSLDGAAFASCSSPKSYTNLKNAKHTFKVRAIDAAGNVDATPAVRSWTVDTVKPSISGLVPKPGSSTKDRTPAIKATVKDNLMNLSRSHIKLYLDGKRITTFSYNRSTDRLTYTSKKLSLGKHTVKLVARDAAGNVMVKKWSFKVVR